MQDKSLTIGISERPASVGKWIVLSLQHVFAMFGATVLVPLLTGLDVGVALVASGIGTLIYIVCTRAKVPVYLGSSFAYIPAISAAVLSPAGAGAAYVGLMVVGLVYAGAATVIRFVGSGWLKSLLPPIVIGPMIIIIGMTLAPVAVSSSGLAGGNDAYISPRLYETVDVLGADATADTFEDGSAVFVVEDGTLTVTDMTATPSSIIPVAGMRITAYGTDPLDPANNNLSFTQSIYEYDGTTWVAVSGDGWKIPMVALITFIAVVLLSILARGFLRIVPFLVAILIGYAASVVLGVVDLGAVFAGYAFFQLPDFTFVGTYAFDLSAVLMFAPLAFVTIAEHIGDHAVLGEITGNDFLTEPGLQNTLMGDGIATFVSAAIGGPANTTYGENTGVIAVTRVGSVYVTGLAAVIAITLGFFGWIQAFINSIPWAVIGGMTIVLYGLIAANGVKVLIKDRTDLSDMKNLIIVSTMLVIGLGGASLPINSASSLSGMSLALVSGVLLNGIITGLSRLSSKR